MDYEVKECVMSKERVNIDIRTVTPSTVNVRTLKLRNMQFKTKAAEL
jgi:hypothetical protein